MHDGGGYAAQLDNAYLYSAFCSKAKTLKNALFYCPALGTRTGLDNKNEQFFETRSRDCAAIRFGDASEVGIPN